MSLSRKLLYLDAAATAFPKAPGVAAAMARAVRTCGNPGRGGHRLSLAAARVLFSCREKLAARLGVADSRRVLFTRGCTESINLVLLGLLGRGARCVTTSMEHNSVARPLTHLARTRGVRVEQVPSRADGTVNLDALAAACTKKTDLLALNHGSNVCGSLVDLGRLRAALPDVPLLVDAAQTAGIVPLEVDRLDLDYVAFSGHKGLLGPQGIGGLCLSRRAALPRPLIFGGTGSRSEEAVQPDFLPDMYESGTLNLPGVAGLAAGLDFLAERGPGFPMEQERSLAAQLLAGLRTLRRVRLLGPRASARRLAVFSLLVDGMDPGAVALALERRHGILVRSGLHCSPWAHRTLGTFPHGTVRLSFSLTTPNNAVPRALEALEDVAARGA